MGEPKAFASLSSGLLARKGAARPAMRPQGFGQVGSGLEDLGWNDMGFEAPKPALAPVRDDQHDAFGDELSEPALRNPLAALTPVASPVHDQQAEIEDRFGGYTDDAGEEEEVDETAELYDPNALEVDADGEEEESELEEVEAAPLIQTKAARPTPVASELIAEPVAPEPVVLEPVVEPVAHAPVVELVRPVVVATPATKAQAAMAANDLVTAVSLAESAVEYRPQDASFRALLGNIYLASGRFASAEATYRDSLSLNRAQPQVILKLALVQIALGKADEASAMLASAQSIIDPTDLDLALALAGRPD